MVATSPWARRCFLAWGALPAEADGVLPGDRAARVSASAVTIDAPPSAAWPRLIQMGNGHGGAYTDDWIENLLGPNMHSADEILPQFQHLAAGHTLPLGTSGRAIRVEICEPERTLGVPIRRRRPGVDL
uniref:hypothetical protein n=1 Tax=Paractinoplanes polyasparticus TaxID=2856853 RepID=UPI001C84CF2E|nr:hypothetical protein [Actinoplanes polyasparticus]